MGLSCGMSMVKYGLFIFNLVCAVSKTFPNIFRIRSYLQSLIRIAMSSTSALNAHSGAIRLNEQSRKTFSARNPRFIVMSHRGKTSRSLCFSNSTAMKN